MKIFLTVFVSIILVTLAFSVKTSYGQSQVPSLEDTPSKIADGNATQVNETGVVMPINPDGSRWFQFQSEFYDWSVGAAVFTHRDLLGTQFPLTYDNLLESGILPFIFRNRYTGENISSTVDYSPGDLFYQTDPETGTFVYKSYQGIQDVNYDPELTGGEWRQLSMIMSTDGKTLSTVMELGQDPFSNQIPAKDVRSDFGIPSNDEARARIFVVYNLVNDLMYWCGEFVDNVPPTLNDYIGMVGEKNPDAWVNPYTGEPMKEVDWYNVPMYFDTMKVTSQIPDLSDSGKVPRISNPDNIAGNYSYKMGFSPIIDGELRGYVQFYFKEPDGSIASYVGIGVGPEEYRSGMLDLNGVL